MVDFEQGDKPNGHLASKLDPSTLKHRRGPMKNLFVRFIREDEGQDLIEYAFLAVFIALAVTAAIQGIGGALNTQFGNIASQVSTGS
jgi:pilus assembly protein Flp/PilA